MQTGQEFLGTGRVAAYAFLRNSGTAVLVWRWPG